MKTESDYPACPAIYTNQDGSIQHDVYLGLTKREYFASLAMQGICAGDGYIDMSFNLVASEAVKCADALIKELNR